MFWRAICSGLLLWLGLPAAAGAEESSRSLYLRHQREVVQIRVIDAASGAKAGIGSGFLVSPQGHVATNFHVIANLVHRPAQYRAEYLLADETVGALQLVDVDVVHDLAILQGEGLPRPFLRLDEKLPAKGEKLFSLGNPFDLGLTIVEGTFNGLLEKSLYEKIHFTGSINPGMSGGPSLNRAGRVVGVNVSTAGNQVSFLVPAKYLEKLLRALPAGKTSPPALLQKVRDQLLANQDNYLQQLLRLPFPHERLDRFSLPGQLAPYVQCWGNTPAKEDALLEETFRTCSTSDDIFVSDELSTGTIEFRHEWIRTGELGSVRFYNYLEGNFQGGPFSWQGEKEDFTNFECRDGFVAHDGLDSKVVFCLRGYRKLAGLFDLFLSANTLAGEGEALYSALAMKGVSYDNAIAFSRTYLEAIRWNR